MYNVNEPDKVENYAIRLSSHQGLWLIWLIDTILTK